MIARRLVIHGRVQGVWFRDWAIRKARELGVAGWVRNRRDGSVEAFAEGEREAVEAFVRACGEGPPKALVEGVEEAMADVEGLSGFERHKIA